MPFYLKLIPGDVTIPGSVTLTVDSDLNGASPQFTLTCISTGGPATTVTWTRDSATAMGDAVTVLDNAETATYTHTLTVTGRLGGLYQYSVSNSKPSSAAAELSVAGTAYTQLLPYVLHGFFLYYTLCIEPDPVENFAMTSSSETGFSFSWSPPSTAAHLTTGYRLTCSPLLEGIPTPDPLIIAPTATTATVTGLLSGVTYSCDIITLTSQGASQPRTLTSSTVETGQCGPNTAVCIVYCVYS